MKRKDAENALEALKNKPFILRPTSIELAGGYAITTKAHLDRLEELDNKQRRKGDTP